MDLLNLIIDTIQVNKRFFKMLLIIIFVVTSIVIASLFLKQYLDGLPLQYQAMDDSMDPAIKKGDTIAIDRNYFTSNPISRGDIVAIDLKTNEDLIISRIVALPGDDIIFQDGRIVLNGNALVENYLKEPGYIATENEFNIVNLQFRSTGSVPPRSLLILNDNRIFKEDSRKFGLISVNNIYGKALIG